MEEEIKNNLLELCENYDITPTQLNRICEDVKRLHIQNIRRNKIEFNRKYIGKCYDLEDNFYYKVVSNYAETCGDVTCLVVPKTIDVWKDYGYGDNIYYGFDHIDLMAVSSNELLSEFEIDQSEFVKAMHNYINILNDLKFE